MKYIACEKIKMDRNGNQRFGYNFIDTEKPSETAKNNKEFSYFGRVTKAGVVNQKHPFEMVEWMRKPFVLLGMPAMLKQNKILQKIRKFRKAKNGYESSAILDLELRKQSERLAYVAEFMKLPIEI